MKVRFYILLGVFFTALLVAAILPPISQPSVYHQFADQRSFWLIPNFFNVASNLIFLFVGMAGLVFLKRVSALSVQKTFAVTSECWSYLAIFTSVLMVSIGSVYYHWGPENSTLFWDRLPIAIGIMSLLAATVTERIGVRLGLRILPVLIMIGITSVVYWYWSEQQGIGNLNFYIVVQFCSILLIVLLAILFPSRYTRGSDIYGVIALYGLAKLAEILDREIYQLGQIVSGHTLKHIFAGLAVYWMLRMLQKRTLRVENLPGSSNRNDEISSG
ncbi:alkaline phytoceramidase [Nitrosomonas sp. HPC101]|uniref:alkaline phytoceramidase n=1 Tax=Nitrosomonas sp. HPC101 TaxID=1658667 RepID=UPI00136FFA7F|nr:alkaline phytoceramidase [Nitrosomonas sp. HPC101]MXS85944.1 alkaline phytoceramidase [Nitrosomonas sp. HPC101]